MFDSEVCRTSRPSYIGVTPPPVQSRGTGIPAPTSAPPSFWGPRVESAAPDVARELPTISAFQLPAEVGPAAVALLAVLHLGCVAGGTVERLSAILLSFVFSPLALSSLKKERKESRTSPAYHEGGSPSYECR